MMTLVNDISSPQISPPATPETAAINATQSNAIQRNRLSLLGLFGVKGDLKALVRLPNGRVKTVQTGGRVARSTVLGIDAKGIVLEKAGRTHRIEMPGY